MKIETLGNYQMLIDDDNNIVYPPVADRIVAVGENLYAVYASKKVGLIKSNGSLVVPFEFSQCSKFSHGLIKMEKGYSFYFYNKNGKLIYVANWADVVSDFDGEKICMTNYDEDPYTHQRQIASRDVYIDSITKSYDDYSNLQKVGQKVNKLVDDNVDDADEHYTQESLF